MKPKLSVCMVTYNHEKYIKQAIESVLMQKTNFDYELLIGEDCSKDNTQEIVLKYKKKYPKIIKTDINEKNIGGGLNFIQTLKRCKAEYIAYLEGDDYWTDPYKLQKQVDFLENNHDHAICFHNARILNQKTGNSSKLFFYGKQKHSYKLKDILRNNFIPTLTCMFRNHLFGKLPAWYKNAFPGDWPLHIINAHYGKIGYIDEIMATYRYHDKGIVTGSNPIYNYQRYIKTFKNIRTYIPTELKPIADETISRFYFELSDLYYKNNNIREAYNAFTTCLKIKPFNSSLPKKRLLTLSGKLFFNRIPS